MNELRGARDSDKGEASYPEDHEPGMEVPRGGAMCANCRYLADDRKSCTEENFIAWNGSEKIPAEIDSYCSDWWQGSETKPLSQREANKMSLSDILNSLRPAEEKQSSVERVT